MEQTPLKKPADKFSDDGFEVVYNPNKQKKNEETLPAGSIEIHKNSITHLKTDAVVNAANHHLQQGSGVCGAIFKAAGEAKLQAACDRIGYCHTGHAVLTPAFNMKDNKYIIHAVGPRYYGGNKGEAKYLAGCVRDALDLAMNNGCRSIGFPLISSGVFGYPVDEAWHVELQACMDFIRDNPHYPLQIVFVGTDPEIVNTGKKILAEMEAKNAL